MNALTIVVILIFLIFIGLGFARGLIKSVFRFDLNALALLLAYILSPIISNVIIQNTSIDDNISDKIYSTIEEKVEEKVREEVSDSSIGLDENTTNQIVDQVMGEEPNRNTQIEFIQELKLPDFLQKALIENNHSEMKQTIGVSSFYDYISTYLARMIINAIGFFVTFLFLSLLFNLTLLLMNIVMKMTGLNGLNRIGGALLGFLEALIIVWVIFIIIDMLVGTPIGENLMIQINENKLLSIIYEKNVIARFIENLIKDI